MSIVKIKTRDTLSTGIGTKITTDTGAEIHGITSVVVSLDMKQINTARLELDAMCAFEGTAEAVFVMADPSSGEKKSYQPD
jgi:hypothetical protein